MTEASPLVELLIYGYFVVVAALGCYLHGRLWIESRGRTGDESVDETPGLEG